MFSVGAELWRFSGPMSRTQPPVTAWSGQVPKISKDRASLRASDLVGLRGECRCPCSPSSVLLQARSQDVCTVPHSAGAAPRDLRLPVLGSGVFSALVGRGRCLTAAPASSALGLCEGLWLSWECHESVRGALAELPCSSWVLVVCRRN